MPGLHVLGLEHLSLILILLCRTPKLPSQDRDQHFSQEGLSHEGYNLCALRGGPGVICCEPSDRAPGPYFDATSMDFAICSCDAANRVLVCASWRNPLAMAS